MEAEPAARGTAARGCFRLRPALSSPPAHTAPSGMAVSQGVRSQCHRVTPRSAVVLWLQATSQLPAWPEPSLSLLEQFRGLAARALLAGFHSSGTMTAQGTRAGLRPPASPGTPVRCESRLGVAGTCKQTSWGCQYPLWWWQRLRDGRGLHGKPPQHRYPPHPAEGLSRGWGPHCQVATISPATSVPK